MRHKGMQDRNVRRAQHHYCQAKSHRIQYTSWPFDTNSQPLMAMFLSPLAYICSGHHPHLTQNNHRSQELNPTTTHQTRRTHPSKPLGKAPSHPLGQSFKSKGKPTSWQCSISPFVASCRATMSSRSRSEDLPEQDIPHPCNGAPEPGIPSASVTTPSNPTRNKPADLPVVQIHDQSRHQHADGQGTSPWCHHSCSPASTRQWSSSTAHYFSRPLRTRVVLPCRPYSLLSKSKADSGRGTAFGPVSPPPADIGPIRIHSTAVLCCCSSEKAEGESAP